MRGGRWVAACLSLLVLTGCGARVSPAPVGVSAVRTAGDSAEDPAATASGGPAVPQSAAGPEDSKAPPSMSPPVSDGRGFGAKHNNGVVTLALVPECVAPGGLLVVTIAAPAKAGLGMVIGYADNQAHGSMLTGETDAAGRYTWRVPVDPTVPEGQARVLVSSTGANWSQEGGGTADKVFRVARAGC